MPAEPSRHYRFLQRNDWFDSALFRAGAWGLLCFYVVFKVVSNVSVSIEGFDDSIPLVATDLVRRGRVPGIDFSTVYPPLPYYLIAAAFRLFGRTFLVCKALNAAVYFATVVAIAQFFRMRAGRLRPLAPLMALLVATGIGELAARPAWPGFALGLLAVLVYASGLDQPRAGAGIRWRLVAAGTLAGMAALFRFNFGLYALAVPAMEMAMAESLTRDSLPPLLRLRRLLAPLATFAIPFALINTAVYASICGRDVGAAILRMAADQRAMLGPLRFIDLPWHAAGFMAWPCAWVFVRILLTSDRLSGRALVALCPALLLLDAMAAGQHTPSIAIWLTVLGILVVAFLHTRVLRLSRAEFCMLLWFACGMHYYLTRADEAHASTVVIALLLTVPMLIPTNADGATSAAGGRGLTFVLLAAAIWTVGLGTVDMPQFVDGVRTLASGDLHLPVSDAELLASGGRSIPWVENVRTEPEEERQARSSERKVVEFVRSRTAPGEPIFVGVKDHSRVFASDVRVYWLADRIPGCRYIQLDAGVVSRAEVQRQIVADLQRNGVRWAVLEDRSGQGDVSFLRRVTAGSTVLDEFLATNYREVTSFGPFSIVQRIAKP